MKNTMKLLVIFLPVILMSCNEKKFSGKIVSNQPLQLVTKDKKPFALQAGEVSAEFKVAKKDRLDIILHQNGKKTVVPVKVGFELKKIQNGDKIHITPAVSGQPYTLSGDYQVDYSSTNYVTETVSCSYEYNHRQVCDYVHVPGYCTSVSNPDICHTVRECDPTSTSSKEHACRDRQVCSSGGSREVCYPSSYENRCHTVSDTFYGYKDVTSYGSTTKKYYTLDILDNSSAKLGQIKFGETNYDRTVTNETACRNDGGWGSGNYYRP